MKSTKNTKYAYWKWLLLNKHTKETAQKTGRNIVAVYNPTLNIMFRFDLDKCKIIKTRWEGLDWLFENCLGDYLTIGEQEKFYNSLPNNKKRIFWDCVARSMKNENDND